MINIVLAGPRGKMGQEALKMIASEKNFKLLAVVDRIIDPNLLSQLDSYDMKETIIATDIEECFRNVKPDVFVDLTNPEVGRSNTLCAIRHGIRSVIGTTGFSTEDIESLSKQCEENETGCIIAPNFAIGAILMMKFSQLAAKFMPDVEIIELHHDQKKDSPSGTALKTAQLINESRGEGAAIKIDNGPARGIEISGINIHSVRLNGLVAHQEVIFGGTGQSLTIKHDSYNRTSFMTGLKLSINSVMNINTLVYGLENIIE
ncbi:MAG: dapB [Bacillales bacterium]|jgi:4-hydroxy-tetrahydrodipicolinate reductase|nr:dapB [Bacillales bacterium]